MFSRAIVTLRSIKSFGAHQRFPAVMPAMRSFGTAAIATPVAPSSDVVIPDLVDTLEWVLDSPPNVHQFEEPPIIVEVEHLKNLKVSDD